MKKFTLQRVLELKERREQASAVRLAEARTAAEAAREGQALVERLRVAGGAAGVAAGGRRTVGQLQNASYLMQRLDQRIDDARLVVQAAEARVHTCFAEFALASRERRVLDRLRERKLDELQAAEMEMEQKTMDDVALSRFTRAARPGQGGSA
jgi:flagellar protein FliJ